MLIILSSLVVINDINPKIVHTVRALNMQKIHANQDREFGIFHSTSQITQNLVQYQICDCQLSNP